MDQQQHHSALKAETDRLNAEAWELRATDMRKAYRVAKEALDHAIASHHQQGIAESKRTLAISGLSMGLHAEAYEHAMAASRMFRDSEEITVVTDSRNLPLMGEYERNAENWKLLNIRCGKPFYCVGFLAAIAQQMASYGIDIVMTSTFSNDHVLVKEEEAEMAIGLLCDLGFSKL